MRSPRAPQRSCARYACCSPCFFHPPPTLIHYLQSTNSQLLSEAGVKLRAHADIAHLIAVGFQAPPLGELILTLNDVLLRIRHVGREREVKILGDALLNRDARPRIRAISPHRGINRQTGNAREL